MGGMSKKASSRRLKKDGSSRRVISRKNSMEGSSKSHGHRSRSKSVGRKKADGGDEKQGRTSSVPRGSSHRNLKNPSAAAAAPPSSIPVQQQQQQVKKQPTAEEKLNTLEEEIDELQHKIVYQETIKDPKKIQKLVTGFCCRLDAIDVHGSTELRKQRKAMFGRLEVLDSWILTTDKKESSDVSKDSTNNNDDDNNNNNEKTEEPPKTTAPTPTMEKQDSDESKIPEPNNEKTDKIPKPSSPARKTNDNVNRKKSPPRNLAAEQKIKNANRKLPFVETVYPDDSDYDEADNPEEKFYK